MVGCAVTTVDPGFFADNYLRLIPFAAHLGVFPNLYGGTRNAPPSNEDIARLIAVVLGDPARHDGQRYRPTGPELLSVSEMAALLERVLGRRVRAVPMPFWLFNRAARMQGVSSFEMAMFRAYMQDHRQGAFALGAPSNDLLAVTGQPGEPFEATARRYAASPAATRSPAATVKAAWDFLRTPLMPGYDLDRYENVMAFPSPQSPRWSLEDERWQADRCRRDATRTAIQPIQAAVA